MSSKLKLALKIAIPTVGILAAGGWGYRQGMVYGLIRYNEYDIRSEGILQVGDLAPDIELASLATETPVRISGLYALKPLVLVFGSYT